MGVYMYTQAQKLKFTRIHAYTHTRTPAYTHTRIRMQVYITLLANQGIMFVSVEQKKASRHIHTCIQTYKYT
jgi:hypothetical protein